MKKLLLLLWVALIGITTTNVNAFTSNDKVVKIKTSAKCGMCKRKLEREVSLSKGVKEAQLDLADKVLTVKYHDGKTDEDKIRETVTKIGYDADSKVAVQASHDKLPKCCRKSSKEHMD
jgi:copper chaperone CopZ